MPKPKKNKITVDSFRLEAFLVKELRRAFRRAPHYSEAKRRAKVEIQEKTKNGKLVRRVAYRCNSCGNLFLDRKNAREIAVDHIIPVIDPERGWEGIEIFIKRLFCSIDNLQVLCNYKGLRDGKPSCHKLKTDSEKAIAARRRKSNGNDIL